MADEVMKEADFPCPCGKGILRIEVLEHDTWASGRHSRWNLLCDDCRGKYQELFLEHALVTNELHNGFEQKRHELYQRRRAIGEKAAERYSGKFSEYVKGLKFATSMHDAIGGSSSIRKFRERTRYGDELDRMISEGLKERPLQALKQIGIEDAEISTELKSIEEEEAVLKRQIKDAPKFPIPNIDVY